MIAFTVYHKSIHFKDELVIYQMFKGEIDTAKIVFQRGYLDKLSLLKQNNLAIE